MIVEREGADVLLLTDQAGNLPIHRAAGNVRHVMRTLLAHIFLKSLTDIVKYLLERAPHTINALNAYELTPLGQLLANVQGIAKTKRWMHVLTIPDALKDSEDPDEFLHSILDTFNVMLPFAPDLDCVSANEYTPLILALQSSPMIDDGQDELDNEKTDEETGDDGTLRPSLELSPGVRLKMLPMFSQIIKTVRLHALGDCSQGSSSIGALMLASVTRTATLR